MIKMDEIIMAIPTTLGPGSVERPRTTWGRVCYIHPEGRYYEVEFTFTNGKFRESRFFTERERRDAINAGIIHPVRNRAARKKSPVSSTPPTFTMAEMLFEDDPFETGGVSLTAPPDLASPGMLQDFDPLLFNDPGFMGEEPSESAELLGMLDLDNMPNQPLEEPIMLPDFLTGGN